MNDLTIRAAREEEVDAVLDMYEWLLEPPGYTPRSWNPNRARESLAEAIASPTNTVMVAETVSSYRLVGIVTAYLDLNSVRYGRRCWIEDLAVDPSHRSAGIGKALLDTAKAWAKEHGASHLELDTGLARSSAQRFYEREDPDTKGYSYSWALD